MAGLDRLLYSRAAPCLSLVSPLAKTTVVSHLAPHPLAPSWCQCPRPTERNPSGKLPPRGPSLIHPTEQCCRFLSLLDSPIPRASPDSSSSPDLSLGLSSSINPFFLNHRPAISSRRRNRFSNSFNCGASVLSSSLIFLLVISVVRRICFILFRHHLSEIASRLKAHSALSR